MPENRDPKGILNEIVDLVATLPTQPELYAGFSTPERRLLRSKLEVALKKLEAVWLLLDSVRTPAHVFDLSDPKLVAKLVSDTLLLQPRETLSAAVAHRFYGAGVYAIYYNGPFDSYRPISGKEHPIYVGKADPAELHAVSPRHQGEKLHTRLKDHQRSISSAPNLDLADFDCRYLVVKSAWVETAENYLIEHFKPVWNKEMRVCDGFGKHGDDAKTRKNQRSPWDTLHPGGPWATSSANTPNEHALEQIKERIASHFLKFPPVP